MKTLAADFYARPVLEVARDLVGCTVEHGGCAGVIVETEAYHDSEPACHAFAGLTPRTRTLFGEPGRAYVYRSYGVHALLNAVCEPEGVGAGVLIRALQPVAGIELMRARRYRGPLASRDMAADRSEGGAGAPRDGAGPREQELCSGPGKLTQALGIWLSENDSSLSSGPVLIRPRAGDWLQPQTVVAPRVGISRAVELPWRFCLVDSAHVSSPRPSAVPRPRAASPRARRPGPSRAVR
ncbi:MAG: DNA-3-methyladenine glycosylase [Solirubrobacterales bacterium]|nr:DNA-3-methyladenine glycosylase [Solirubrobacterales bacterium]